LDRVHSLEQERDTLKLKYDELKQKGSGHKDDLPTTIVLPSLASLLERYRIITSDELPPLLITYATFLATQKNKKITKRFMRKAGINLNRAMEESWKKCQIFLINLITKTITNFEKFNIIEEKNKNDMKEKYIIKMFMQFISYVNRDNDILPINDYTNEVLQGMGNLKGFPDVEKKLKEYVTHIFQLWWSLILIPNTEIKPAWKEELVPEYYTLISDLNVKDGAIRFPPLIANDGRVLYRGEARPIRKDKGSKKTK